MFLKEAGTHAQTHTSVKEKIAIEMAVGVLY